jgi:hypothetical protein
MRVGVTDSGSSQMVVLVLAVLSRRALLPET